MSKDLPLWEPKHIQGPFPWFCPVWRSRRKDHEHKISNDFVHRWTKHMVDLFILISLYSHDTTLTYVEGNWGLSFCGIFARWLLADKYISNSLLDMPMQNFILQTSPWKTRFCLAERSWQDWRVTWVSSTWVCEGVCWYLGMILEAFVVGSVYTVCSLPFPSLPQADSIVLITQHQ